MRRSSISLFTNPTNAAARAGKINKLYIELLKHNRSARPRRAGTSPEFGKRNRRRGAAWTLLPTDGLRWRIYRPVLPEGADLIPANIVLELRRDISLTEDTLNDFYRWLNVFLFRSSQLELGRVNTMHIEMR